MDLEWDPVKSEATERQRGISSTRAAAIFSGRRVEWIDNRKDYGEQRHCAIGPSSGELLLMVYTRRTQNIRIISVRRANRKERALWHSRA